MAGIPCGRVCVRGARGCAFNMVVAAGVSAVVISEDRRMQSSVTAVHAHGCRVSQHLEYDTVSYDMKKLVKHETEHSVFYKSSAFFIGISLVLLR